MDVVAFEHVTKQHRKALGRTRSIRSDLVGRLHRNRGAMTQPVPALDDVSFAIERGSAVALVGANGAGKSTALRLMSRIIYPSAGRVRMRGRVGALLEVGSGVHPDLSGRENVWLYGSIIGIPRIDIRRRFDEIVDFAELSSAIDRQAKFYSSGMQLRLGFAIATFLEPQTLLVDESLATADLNFQLKCVDRLATLVRQGTTLIFVSHEAAAVEALCTRALLLERGRLVYDADTKETLAEYRRRLEDQRQAPENTSTARADSTMRVAHAACLDTNGRPATKVPPRGAIRIEVTIELSDPVEPVLELAISDGHVGDLIVCNSYDDGLRIPASAGSQVISCWLDALPLTPRSYRVWAGLRDRNTGRGDAVWSEIAAFRIAEPVVQTEGSERAITTGGPVGVEHRWQVEPG